jgi:uncharacterized lipoprotein YbaY
MGGMNQKQWDTPKKNIANQPISPRGWPFLPPFPFPFDPLDPLDPVAWQFVKSVTKI